MPAALKEGDLGADALEELRQLDGYRSASENEQRFGLLPQLEQLVAGQVAGLVEPGNRRPGRYRAGGDDEAGRLEEVIPGPQPAGVLENGAFLVEGEPRAAQLLDAVVGEGADQALLAADDRLQVGAGLDRQQAELRRPAHQRHDVGRAQDGLARHAAAQDAEAPEGAVIDDGYVGAGVAGGGRGRVSGGAAADDDYVVGSFRHVCRSV